jgi:competence protein ComGC
MNNLLIIIVLIVIIIILIINRRTREKFTTTDDINQAVNDLYKADVNAIRNLSNFATEIKNNNDTLTIDRKSVV